MAASMTDKAEGKKTGKASLKQKVAIITGAGRGIGRAIALKLAAQDMAVVIADIDEKTGCATAEEIKNKGVDALFIKTDVSDQAQVDALISRTMDMYGRIDVLVNNAGILSTAMIEDLTVEEWDRVMSINVRSMLLCTKAVLKHMKAGKWGRIINIASVAGRMGGFSSGCAYATSKAAVIGFTRTISRRLAPQGITVNAVAPGTTASEMAKGFTDDDLAMLVKNIPVGRLGQPDNIAVAVAMLASDEASFITGSVIDVNGGMFTG